MRMPPVVGYGYFLESATKGGTILNRSQEKYCQEKALVVRIGAC